MQQHYRMLRVRHSSLHNTMPNENQEQTNPVSMGELYRLILRLETRLNTLQTSIQASMVNRDVYSTFNEGLIQRISDLEQSAIRQEQRRSNYLVALLGVGITDIGGIIAAIIANFRVH